MDVFMLKIRFKGYIAYFSNRALRKDLRWRTARRHPGEFGEIPEIWGQKTLKKRNGERLCLKTHDEYSTVS
jgi:hypothetical protein